MDAVLFCLIVAVTDGDTLRMVCDDERIALVRLAEVDAPELKQPFGQASRDGLERLCYGKSAAVVPRGLDRWGRLVARVTCDGRDASAELARAGLAWAYTRYLTDPAIAELQVDARSNARGLWGGAEQPVAPWEWRSARR